MPIICMKSSYLANHYPHFIDFKMLRLIWSKMAETHKICKNGRSALIWPKPRLSIYNVVKWSLRVNWVQYEPNLRIHLLGICTYAILAPWTKFWPHGPNFDQISQIRSVISYLGQKNCISRSKVVQFGNFKFSTLQDPQNPKSVSYTRLTLPTILLV